MFNLDRIKRFFNVKERGGLCMKRSEYLKESDAWFKRNIDSYDENNCSKETRFISDFLKRNKDELSILNVSTY